MYYCNRGCWPLLWPFRNCRHCSCRCSISGNYRTRSRLPLLSPEPLRTQTAVRHRRFLCSFEEAVAIVVSIFLFYNNNSNIYLNAGRSIQLFPSFAIARFLHGFTCHIIRTSPSRSQRLMLTGSHASRYIASRSRQSRSLVALPPQMPV